MTIRSLCVLGATAALLGNAAIASAATPAAERPDLSGYWLIENAQEKMLADDGKPPSLKPAAAKLYAKNTAAKEHHQSDFDPVTRCVMPGMPRMMTFPYPIEILQRPDELAMLFAWNRLSRDMSIGGKGFEPDYPLAAGVSVAHWEGQSLVIKTAGLRGDTWLDAYGLPHGEQMTIGERLSLSDGGARLVDQMTIADPQTFKAPWKVTLSYRKLPEGFSFSQDVCLDRVDSGKPAVDYTVK